MGDAAVDDRWESGAPYEQFIGRWSRQLAPPFLDWLRVPPGLRWLDVGCGTGALSAAIHERCMPAVLTGIDPSSDFLSLAAHRLGDAARLEPGSATAIPFGENAFDAVVSGLVLNFVGDLPAALREMARVTAPGGLVAAYVWDYAGKMEMLRCFWDAASALDPAAAVLDEGRRFSICGEQALEALFIGAGMADVATVAIDIPMRFSSFDAYWTPFLGGQGPAPAYVMSLDDAARARLRERIRMGLPADEDGSILLTARAWAVQGSVSK